MNIYYDIIYLKSSQQPFLSSFLVFSIVLSPHSLHLKSKKLSCRLLDIQQATSNPIGHPWSLSRGVIGREEPSWEAGSKKASHWRRRRGDQLRPAGICPGQPMGGQNRRCLSIGMFWVSSILILMI